MESGGGASVAVTSSSGKDSPVNTKGTTTTGSKTTNDAGGKASAGSGVVSEEESRVPTPQNTGTKLPLAGPGLPAEAEKPQQVSLCRRCGLKIDAADTKMIPTQKVWFIFLSLFCFCCWWISWIPFLCKSCNKPVEICPHCYRRTDRPIVGSETDAIVVTNP